MKKKVLTAAAVLVILAGIWAVGTGFTRVAGVFIGDYTVSDDGSAMTITVSVSSSAGHIRKVAFRRPENGKLCLEFISAFGGINGNICAKNVYVIPLDEDTEFIGIYKSKNYYEPALVKSSSGEWVMVK